MRGIGYGSIEETFSVENGILERSPESHPPEELYIARILDRDSQELPVNIQNATHRETKLTKETPGPL
jgi:hypothetical protein